MAEKLKLYGFNNLTKSLSFNIYDICYAKSAREQQDYIKYINEQYNSERLTAILEKLTEMIRLLDRYEETFSLLMIDVDNFKQINDNWGHGAGDHVLQQFGLLLPQQVRDRDLVARFGGEEFMLLLSDVQLFEAHAIVERIRASLQSHVFEQLPPNARVTASFGVAQYEHTINATQLFVQADQALYRAKEIRNSVRVYEP